MLNPMSRFQPLQRLAAVLLAGGLLAGCSCSKQKASPESAGAAGGSKKVVLFDGSSADQWQTKTGEPVRWTIEDGALVVGKGDIYSKETFHDFKVHLEFWLPATPGEDAEQAKSNSGVFFQDAYEIQVLDSWQRPVTTGSCGAIYKQRAPTRTVPSRLKPGRPMISSIAQATVDADGKATANAHVTVVHNGTTIHDNVEILQPTSGKHVAKVLDPAPLRLQDHSHPVRYRNIWVERLN